MIPAELARGTFIGENYGVDPEVKLLTIATKEIPDHAFRRWEATARHYGYNYEVVGRNEPWKGFGTKIRLYHERLQTVTEPYTVLTDCTDLFLCGSSTELKDKFVRLGLRVIVGGEMEMHYPGNTHDKTELRNFFDQIRESAQAYPNSGFIMGKTEDVAALMALHLGYSDDQVPCFDTIYDNKFPLHVDYHTVLIGNVPNYRDPNKSTKYFEFDQKSKRYRNVHSDELPVVLHFPGKNWGPMQEFFMNTQQDIVTSANPACPSSWGFMMGSDPANSGIWIFLGMILLIAIIVLLICHSLYA
jgi:hypothetical protein